MKSSLEFPGEEWEERKNLTFLSCLPELKRDFEGLGDSESDSLRLERQR